MTEYWERTVVVGTDAEKIQHSEEVLHKRGEDPMVLACRRNHELAGCGVISMRTVEAFSIGRKREEGRRRKKDIPRDNSQEEEWDW